MQDWIVGPEPAYIIYASDGSGLVRLGSGFAL